MNSCTAFVKALKDADLWGHVPDWLLETYWPSASAVPSSDPCKGTIDVRHDHFFTAEGQFGSFDDHGVQVDYGEYTVAGNEISFPSHEGELGYGTIVVGYAIGADGRLTFDVDVPASCRGDCAVAYGWAISAFYPVPFSRAE